MKVGQTGSNQVQNQAAPDAKRAQKAGATGDTKRSSAAEASSTRTSNSEDVKADISPQAKEFARVKAAANDAPDVREDRIAALRQRISEGKYNINPEAISDRMVDEHLKTADMG